VFGSGPGPSYPGEMPLKPRAAQRTQCTEQGKELGPAFFRLRDRALVALN
jgi:hypothetical protein